MEWNHWCTDLVPNDIDDLCADSWIPRWNTLGANARCMKNVPVCPGFPYRMLASGLTSNDHAGRLCAIWLSSSLPSLLLSGLSYVVLIILCFPPFSQCVLLAPSTLFQLPSNPVIWNKRVSLCFIRKILDNCQSNIVLKGTDQFYSEPGNIEIEIWPH